MCRELNSDITTRHNSFRLANIAATQFLYLSTIGWKTGNKHRIEIWFVELNGRDYILSERKGRAHWVQNLHRNPTVSFSVAGTSFTGCARIVSSHTEPVLAAAVRGLMNNKYGWSGGLIVELTPNSS